MIRRIEAEIVPTPVGVNRINIEKRWAEHHCPHARGGEPVHPLPDPVRGVIVPTPVGVNRR